MMIQQDIILTLILASVFLVGMLFVWGTWKYSDKTDSLMIKATPSFICFLLVVIISLGGLAARQNRKYRELQSIVMKDTVTNGAVIDIQVGVEKECYFE